MKLGKREKWSSNGEGGRNSHCWGAEEDQFGRCEMRKKSRLQMKKMSLA